MADNNAQVHLQGDDEAGTFTPPPTPPQGYQQQPPPQFVSQPSVPAGFHRGFQPSSGPRPLDLAEKRDESFLRVTRMKCNQADEDAVGTGFAGMVPDVFGFEHHIQKRWGGGEYEVTGIYDGKQKSTRVTIAGKSRPIHHDAEQAAQEAQAAEAEAQQIQAQQYVEYERPVGRRQGYAYSEPFLEDPYGPQGAYGRPRSPYEEPPYGQFGPQGPYAQGPYAQGPGPYGQPPFAQGPYGPQGAYGAPPLAAGYAQPQVYGQQAYGQPPYGAPGFAPHGAGPQVVPTGPAYTPVVPNEELEQLKAQLEEARQATQAAAEAAAQEREERRIEAERAAAREREDALKRQFESAKIESDRRLEAIQAEARRQADDLTRRLESLQQQSNQQIQQLMTQLATQGESRGGGAMEKMLEMQMLQMQQSQQRIEQERVDREMRWREENTLRRDEASRREVEWKRDQEKQEQARAHEREREEKRRADEARLEEKRRAEEARHYQGLMEMMHKGQQTPEQMLGLFKTMVDMQPKTNATSQIMDLAQAAVAMRELLGGNEPAESKLETIIKAGGEALGRAVEAVQTRRAAPQPQQQYVQQPQITHQPTQQQIQAQVAYQQRVAAQQQAQAQGRPVQHAPETADPSPDEWGRILSFVVDAHDGGNEPETVATHMHTMITVGMQRPRAVERLEQATVAELRFQLSALSLAPSMASSPFGAKVKRLVQILDGADGAAWMEEVIANLAAIQDSVRQQAAAAHQQQRAENADAFRQSQHPQAPQGRPQVPQAPRPPLDESPEAFAARARGTPGQGPPENLTPEEFARRARGETPKRPTNGWEDDPDADVEDEDEDA